MKNIKFTSEEKKILVNKIQHYFEKESLEPIGQFDAEFLLEFFNKTIGVYHYNRGLQDAQKLLEENSQIITQTLYEMEGLSEFVK
jgi:uncharacterized protein (DUF2164 family)